MSETVYLTFDIDWAHDDLVSHCIKFCEDHQIRATFFVTHATPLLERIRKNSNLELGIHPNFNPLFERQNTALSGSEILNQLKQIVPEATSVRSHSVVQSGRILDLFVEHGFTHDSSTWIPSWAEMNLKPWQDWNGLIRAPFFWSDDTRHKVETSWNLDKLLRDPGLKIFNFHPIHVFLNTEALSRYETSRPFHKEPQKLKEYRCESQREGTMVFLDSLIAEAKRRKMNFGLIKEIQASEDTWE